MGILRIVKDEDNAARGIVAQNMTTSEIKSFGSDAVIMATGGPGIIFGKTTNSMINTGSAASIVYQQGANMQMVNLFKFTQQLFLVMINYA